jgi:hypothetical protein
VDLLGIPAFVLAVDQRDPNASPVLPPPVEGLGVGLPSDAAVVDVAEEKEDCLAPMPGKLWLGEMVLERGDLADEGAVELLMVDWTEV